MTQLDYSSVKLYWDRVKPSMLGPYMMDGFGFPAGAGSFRFREEQQIVDSLTSQQNPDGRVLDLGCGIGHWSTRFAERFSEVVAVDGSQTFYDSLQKRTTEYSNIEAVHCNVMDYEPTGSFEVIFLGGLLMYLNEADVIKLLNRLTPLLTTSGIILCRESTVTEGSESRQEEYQATYRSKQVYTELFHQCQLSTDRTEVNSSYVLLQIGCETMKFWISKVPKIFQMLKLTGHLVYAVLRLSNPWIIRMPRWLGYNFPHLKNHFFLLKPKSEHLRSIPNRQPTSTLAVIGLNN